MTHCHLTFYFVHWRIFYPTWTYRSYSSVFARSSADAERQVREYLQRSTLCGFAITRVEA